MKLAKRLLVLVAVMAMVFSLTACGGEKYPLEYTYKVEWSQGVRGEDATLTLNEDNTFTYTYKATDSKDANTIVMDLTATGTYTKDGDTVTIELGEVKGTAFNNGAEIDMSTEAGYQLTYAQGAKTFTIDGDTFVPVVE